MANIRLLFSSFIGGIITEEAAGRAVDLVPVQSGLRDSLNMIVKETGAIFNRAGTEFVAEIKDSNNPARLIPFAFSDTQTFAIEMGAGYYRFHNAGGTLVNLGNPYEVTNAYAQADIYSVKYVQSGDIMTLVHANYPPRELRRYGNLNWQFVLVTFASKTLAPASCAVVKTEPVILGAVNKSHQYCVTALNAIGYEESPQSPLSNIVLNDLTISGNYNTITWTAVTGAIRYNIYKYSNGTFGFIGQVTGLSFVDDNILPDMTRTIPLLDPVFDSAGNYPSCVCYFEQRRFFAGSINQPQNIWATQSSSDYNMSYSIPSQDSDALRFRVPAQKANGIKHLIPSQDIIAFTSSSEIRIYSQSNDALTPSTISTKPQASNGANDVQPIPIGNYVVYPQYQGGRLREMSFQWQNSSYISSDLCLLASHLFDGKSIIDMAYSRMPTPIVWVLNSDGELLGLTYVPEQKVVSWHRHGTTNGVIESICCVPENGFDVLYMIIKRVIDGVTKRYIERLHTRFFSTTADCFFVDSGLTYRGVPITNVTGLDHLEGQAVAILADGAVMPQQIVSSGGITLPVPASTITVGLPINSYAIPMPGAISGTPDYAFSMVKNVTKVWARVVKSGEFFAGPSIDKLTPIRTRQFEPPGTPATLKTGTFEIPISPGETQQEHTFDGDIVITQPNPLPLSLVFLVREVSLSG